MKYRLPETLEVNGNEYAIRTDFRDVLTVLEAMNDPDLKDEEKALVAFQIIYEDFDEIPVQDYDEAFKKLMWFIDGGEDAEEKPSSKAKMLDFEQDAKILIPAVNRVAGCEVRRLEYLHWWTFVGYYMEVGDCTFSTVMSIRSKRAKGKKLEKWEEEFFAANKDLVLIKHKESEEEKAEKARLNALLS